MADRSRSPARKDGGARSAVVEPVLALGGLSLMEPKMPERVAQALHELVAVCEASDGALVAAAQEMRRNAAGSALDEAAKELEEQAQRLESQALHRAAHGAPLQEAVATLEAKQAARLGAAEVVLQRRRALQKAQEAVLLAEQAEKTAQCDVQQALGEVVRCAHVEEEAGAREREAARLWRRAAERLAAQAREQRERTADVLRSSFLGRGGEDADHAADQGAPGEEAARLLAARSEEVLAFLAEAQKRHHHLAQVVKRAAQEAAAPDGPPHATPLRWQAQPAAPGGAARSAP